MSTLRNKSIIVTFLSLILYFASSGLSKLSTPQQDSSKNATSANLVATISNLSRIKSDLTQDSGEFYRFGDRKIRLLRSLDKIAIRHSAGKGLEIKSRLHNQTMKGINVESELDRERMLVVQTPEVSSLNELQEMMDQLSLGADVNQVLPIYINEESGLEMIPTEQFIIKLAEGYTIEQLKAINNLMGIDTIKPMQGTTNQFILTIPGSTPEGLLSIVELYTQNPAIEWAEPDFLCQIVKSAIIPNDPYYPQQWHLNNIGQSGGTYGADINAPEAWDITVGNSHIVIAIIDDGIDLTHEDLKDNLWNNSEEIPNDGIDNDLNGYIDDTSGWDFCDNDKYPSHSVSDDYHGTMVAGVAAAKGNNNKGVTGTAFGCRVLPLKVLRGNYSSDSIIAEAIRYAAGLAKNGNDRWQGADIINISLGFSESSVVSSALNDAAEKGRNGKGCAIFCASGNEAAGWRKCILAGIPSGTHIFKWEYRKDSVLSKGDDAVWLDSVVFPGGEIETFSNGISTGWSTSGTGTAKWFSDGRHAMTGFSDSESLSVRSGSVGNNESSYLQVTKTVDTGSLMFWVWSSCENYFDGLRFYFDGKLYFDETDISGEPYIRTTVAYPASHPDTIAVGASTDFDYKADYSCYGSDLDFVAPSGGGLGNIWTTDRTGNSGLSTSNYYSFSGTSASSPLAAGVAALMLSKNPNLTAQRIREIMRSSCDKIGSKVYNNGWNEYYGYGRINAKKALDATIIPSVLVCGADSHEALADIQQKLLGTEQFTNVDVLDVHSTTPSLAELQAYDAVLVYSNDAYQNSYSLGNVMADYVDRGGGAVCMMFESGNSKGGNYILQGRWTNEAYYALPRGGHFSGTQATLGAMFDPEHPILQGVTTFDGGSSSYRPSTVGISPGSVKVADWSDGRPLVITKMIGNTRRVDLGFYPVSSDASDKGWTATTDGALLIANALTWVDISQVEELPAKAVCFNPNDGAIEQPLNVILSWSDCVKATSYDVYFGTETNLNEDDFKGNQTETTYNPGILERNTTYYWRIDAKNSDGVTTGDSWYFTTESEPLTPPSKATNPSPSNGATNQSNSTNLSWSDGGNATSYDIYFGIDSTPDSGELKGNQTETTYNPGTLERNKTYYWRIDAKNAAGTTRGDIWSFSTTDAVPTTRFRVVDSSPTSWVARGLKNYTVSPELGWTFVPSKNFDNGIGFVIEGPALPGTSINRWTLNFAAPFRAKLTPGLYTDFQRWPFQNTDRPGLEFTSTGRGDNRASGFFEVLEVTYDTSGNMLTFAADFTHYGEENVSKYAKVEVRYNANTK